MYTIRDCAAFMNKINLLVREVSRELLSTVNRGSNLPIFGETYAFESFGTRFFIYCYYLQPFKRAKKLNYGYFENQKAIHKTLKKTIFGVHKPTIHKVINKLRNYPPFNGINAF